MSDSTVGAHPSRLPVRQLLGLTGLRGIAAWWVVVYHIKEYLPAGSPGWLQAACEQGYLAVDLFFVLSGFIISYNYLPAFSSFNLIGYLRFLGIRLARIYPLHLFMIVLYLANPLAIALASSQGRDVGRYDPLYYVMSILLVQNWGLADHLAWNIPAWSISTEWMAYLLFPLLAWVAKKNSGNILYTLAGVGIPLALLGIGLNLMGETLGTDIPRNGLIRCLCEFSTGAFVYRLWVAGGKSKATKGSVYVLLAVCMALLFMTGIDDIWIVPAMWACTIFLLATEPALIERMFEHRLVEIIGLWSYSTYLAHYFVRDWVKFLLVRDGIPNGAILFCYASATLVASGLLYRFVELPGRRSGRRLVERFVGNPAAGGNGRPG
jgi:peptidoglycan/LPS O-acetylase OafA/YrhL